MADQQKALLEQVSRPQRRLDGSAAADVSMVGQPPAVAESCSFTGWVPMVQTVLAF
jgi:hypothetical protein